MVAIEVVLGTIGCILCTVGGAFCFANRQQNKAGEFGDLHDPRAPRILEFAMDPEDYIARLEEYILRERALAVARTQQAAAVAPAAPPAPTPAPAVAATPAPAPVYDQRAGLPRYVTFALGYTPNIAYPMISPLQQPTLKSPFAGAPIYYV